MNNLVSISTGCIYKTIPDKLEATKKLLKLNPDGIELSFPYPEMLDRFELDKKTLDSIKQLKAFSIHAPWKEADYYSRESATNILTKLERLSLASNPHAVVFHTDIINKDTLDLIDNFNFKPSFENMDYEKDSGRDYQSIKKILDRNPNYGFVFDIAHSLDLGSKTTEELLNLKDKISEVHFSYRSRISGHHELVCLQKERSIFGYLKNIKSVLVLEGTAPSNYEQAIMNEINLIRSM